LLSHDPPKWSRIECFLVSPDWETWFPSQKRLSHLCSDYFPIVLDCGDVVRVSKRFKFENMWLKVEGFVGLVKQWWDSYLFQGSPSFVFARKLKALKLDLKKRNEEVFGNVERNKRILVEDLQAFNALEEGRALGGEEF
jgi:hypothetical protein